LEEGARETETPECFSFANLDSCRDIMSDAKLVEFRKRLHEQAIKANKARESRMEKKQLTDKTYSELPVMNWDDYIFVQPPRECIGVLQIASLVALALKSPTDASVSAVPGGASSASGEAVPFSAASMASGGPTAVISRAKEIHQRLVQGCTELQETELMGLLRVLARFSTATVIVYTVTASTDRVFVWKADHEVHSPEHEYMLRFVYDEDSKNVFLLKPIQKPPNAVRFAPIAATSKSDRCGRLSPAEMKVVAKTRPDMVTEDGQPCGRAVMAAGNRGANEGPHPYEPMMKALGKNAEKNKADRRERVEMENARSRDQSLRVVAGRAQACARPLEDDDDAAAGPAVAPQPDAAPPPHSVPEKRPGEALSPPKKKRKKKTKPTGWS
jgi:hypothetical protein